MATLILIVKFLGTDTTTLSVTQHATRGEAQAVIDGLVDMVLGSGSGIVFRIVGGV